MNRDRAVASLNILYAGQNIALNKAATADADSTAASLLLNGDSTDAWTAEAGSHTVEIDLLQEYSIGGISLLGLAADADYRFAVADSSRNFQAASSLTLTNNADGQADFTASSPLLFVRYIQIEIDSASPLSLSEIEVFAAGSYGCVLSAAPTNNGEASNLRAAPSTEANTVALFHQDDRFVAVGQRFSAGMNWWQLESGAWKRADRVLGRGSCTFLPQT